MYKAPDDNPGPYNWADQEKDHQASLAGIPCAVVPNMSHHVDHWN